MLRGGDRHKQAKSIQQKDRQTVLETNSIVGLTSNPAMQTTPTCPRQTETETESETERQTNRTQTDKEQPAKRQTGSDRDGNTIIGLISNPTVGWALNTNN